ncbi:MAG: SUMF1/EgtB/PvdO family nonheme iron enzyme [Candidatus Tectomicrobia bacterium]|nr:SUMF1/EgtB/PvdO family nonheme iron enzyme [Candidatus Tectomicrobia bacterium]
MGRREPSLPGAPAGVIRDEAPMALVPAGPFLRGAPAPSPPEKDDAPARSVHLEAFSIDRAEVTNAAYARFLEATGRRPPHWDAQDARRAAPSGSPLGDPRREDWSRFSWEDRRPPPGTADLPVTLVTWFDAEAYCAWAGKRLPTEAEWEKAARGADGRRYPWGSAPPQGRANFGGAHSGPLPPGSYPGGTSPYGAADMAGNVAEWVGDYHDPGYYREAPDRNPQGPERGAQRVVRGGFWRDGEERLQTFRRWRLPPAQKHGGVGFRCAGSVK